MVLAITLNVIFAAIVIVGIVTLLGRSIRAQAVADGATAPARRVRQAQPRARREGAFVPARHSA
ncbi:MAG TPA: hypothetical protein VFN87_02010 [Solirubrobacteraceae bacterium]|nr:hypothetical protein [Solirubrobacteraceae bacterium]